MIGIRLQVKHRQFLVIGELGEGRREAVGEDDGHRLMSLMGDDKRAGSLGDAANIVAVLRA